MTGIILYPNVCRESATTLADELGAIALNPFETTQRDFTHASFLINYGCNRSISGPEIFLNKPLAVSKCINKKTTLSILKQEHIPHVEFTEDKNKAKTWACTVVRHNVYGAQAKDISFVTKGNSLPDAPLYTKYFKHKFEFRIVVFRNTVIGRYLKEEETRGVWSLNSMDPHQFDLIDNACIRAAQAVGIDYVGIDVLSNGPDKFALLELNSGPIITPESITAFKSFLNI